MTSVVKVAPSSPRQGQSQRDTLRIRREGQTKARSIRGGNIFNLKANSATVFQEVLAGVLSYLTIVQLMPTYATIFVGKDNFSKTETSELYYLVTGVSTIIFALSSNLPFVIAPSIVYAGSYFKYTGVDKGGALAGQFVANLVAALAIWFGSRADMLQQIPSGLRAGYGCGMSILVAVLGLRGIGILTVNVFAFNMLTWQAAVGLWAIGLSFVQAPPAWRWFLALGVPYIITEIVYAVQTPDVFKGVTDYASYDAMADLKESTVREIDFKDMHDDPKVYFFYVFSTALSLIINTVSAMLILVDAACLQSFRRTFASMEVGDFAVIIGSTSKFRKLATLVPLLGAAGNVVGVTSQAVFVQSLIAIFAGAKTGLAGVVTGVCFIATAWIWPCLPWLVPSHIYGALSVIVALNFFKVIKTVNFSEGVSILQFGLPVVLIPLTFQSIDCLAIAIVLSFILDCANMVFDWKNSSRAKGDGGAGGSDDFEVMSRDGRPDSFDTQNNAEMGRSKKQGSGSQASATVPQTPGHVIHEEEDEVSTTRHAAGTQVLVPKSPMSWKKRLTGLPGASFISQGPAAPNVQQRRVRFSVSKVVVAVGILQVTLKVLFEQKVFL